MITEFTSRRTALVPYVAPTEAQAQTPHSSVLLRPIFPSLRHSPTVLEWCLFCLCTCLTAAGFFLEAVPFFVAYIPFLVAIVSDRLSTKFWSVAGYFIWPVVISAWGLIQLGHNPLYVAPLAFLIVGSFSAITAWGSVGLVGLLLGVIPFFPGSPLLITGSILPGWDIWSYFFLVPFLIFVELHRIPAAKIVYLGLLAIFTTTLHLADFRMGVLSKNAVSAQKVIYPTAQSIAISDIQAVTRNGYWDAIASRIPENTTAILGENIFRHTERVGWSYWCRTAIEKNATLFIGVQGKNSIGEVWKFDAQVCPTPERVYQAQIGVPGITGEWTPNVTDWDEWRAPNPEPQWLICFEAFSMVRWGGVGLSGASHALVISNDKWTEPLPVGVLRRHVGREFDKLFGIKTVHADTKRNIVIVQNRDN